MNHESTDVACTKVVAVIIGHNGRGNEAYETILAGLNIG